MLFPHSLKFLHIPCAALTTLLFVLSQGILPSNGAAAAQEPAAEAPAAQADADSAPKEEEKKEEPPPEAGSPGSALAPAPQGLASLDDPQLAEKLGLNQEQRARIRQILAEREQAIAAVPEAERAGIIEESERKLAEVLSDSQRALWQQEARAERPRLRFNFRFQRWADVLQWLADQGDLSLVLDAPPPGSFNYTDNREYTPEEAIDLVSGVLLTKGYTLIRRDRMLLLINLTEEYPADLIPRVELDELDRRGQFEMVSVLFPLGARNADEVNQEITPLLGPHAKAVPLPKTKQILVTATAGVMRALKAVIESIPEPTPSPAPPQEKPQEKPELIVYAIERATPATVVEVLKSLIPESEARFAVDPKVDQISVYTTPSRHEAVRRVIEQMQADNPPEKKPRLEVYALDESQPQQILATLSPLVPEARLSIDPTRGSLVAWATPADHESIRQALHQMGQPTGEESGRRLAVYPLVRTDSASFLSSLKNLLPRAQIEIDSTTQQLIAVATEADHARIAAALKDMGQAAADENTPRLEVHAIADLDPTTTLATLRNLVPRAQLEVNPQARHLTAIATPADQKRIREAIAQLRRTPPTEESPQVEIHALGDLDPTTTIATLRNLVPRAQLEANAQTRRLTAIATPADQQRIRTTLEQLGQTPPPEETPQVEMHALGDLDPTTTIATLRNLVPRAQLEANAQTRRLTAIATPADQQRIRTTLEQLGQAPPPEETPQVAIHVLGDLDPTTTLNTLRNLVARAQLEINPVSRNLIAVATPGDQERIRQILKQFQTELPNPTAEELRFYPLAKDSSQGLLTLLATVAPTAKVTPSADKRQLMVVAKPKDHDRVQKTVELFEQHGTGEPERKLETYAVTPQERKRVQAILNSLAAELPGIQVIPDTEPGTLAVWADARQHGVIAEILGKLREDMPEGESFRMEAFTLGSADPAKVMALLKELFPEPTRMELDERNRKLFIWARESDQAAIREAIGKMDSGEPGQTQSAPTVYPIARLDPDQTLSLLQQLVPHAKLTVDRRANAIVAQAREDEHELIKGILEKMESDTKPASRRMLAVYPLDQRDPNTLLAMIDTEVRGDAQFIVDDKRKSLLVWAEPDRQKAIGQAIEQLKMRVPEQPDVTSQVYRFRSVDPQIAQSVLRTLVPEAKTELNLRDSSIVVAAVADDHEKIRGILEQMEPPQGDDNRPMLRSYPVSGTEPSVVHAMLAAYFSGKPGVQLSVDAANRRIAAVATPLQHLEIERLIGDMKADGKEPLLRAYPISGADLTVVHSMLTAFFTGKPGVQLSIDATNRRLIAVATPEQHQDIERLIGDMHEGELKPVLRAYPISGADLSVVHSMLTAFFTGKPGVQLSMDPTNRRLVAVATPEQHQDIERLIGDMQEGELKPVLRAYPISGADLTVVHSMLTAFFTGKPGVQLSMDPTNRRLIAVATPEQHQDVERLIGDMHEGELKPVLRAYPITGADLTVVHSMLTAFFTGKPGVQLSMDPANRRLLAVAMPEQHQDIERLIGDMQADQEAPVLKSYAVTRADPSLLLPMIQGLFTGEPRVQLSADTANRRLVAVATPKQHETIARVIRESEEEPEEGNQRSLEVYSLEHSDPTGVQDVLAKLFQRESVRPEWSVDTRGQRLVAIATESQHEVIRSAVDRLRREKTQVEVFQLDEVDPLAAETAIENLFAGTAGDGRAAPHVEADYQTQRLLVRGDAEQIEQIRDVLRKMGESRLEDGDEASTRRFRVVPFDGDAQAVLQEIERIWPQLRENPLKIVTPSAVAPELRRSREEVDNGKESSVDPPPEPPEADSTGKASESGNGRTPPAAADTLTEPATAEPAASEPSGKAPPAGGASLGGAPEGEPRDGEPASEPDGPVEGSELREVESTEKAAGPESAKSDADGRQAAPAVIAAPGEGTITIASDDPQALEQLENLVRGLSVADVLGESDMRIFPLQNADAFQFTQAVRELFRNRPADRRNPFASVSIVPDQRTNSVIVRASRSDRQVIEQLVRSLDIGDLPGALAMNKPTVIPLENLMASEVVELLEEVYRTQLTAGGGREPIPVPSGVPRDVAAILEQINAAKTGPLMTLSVDQATNSLVVLAPLPLVEEVRTLVVDLDRAADEKPARSLKIVTLKKANVESVQQALQRVLQDRGPGRSRSRRR